MSLDREGPHHEGGDDRERDEAHERQDPGEDGHTRRELAVSVGTNRDRIDTWGKDFAVASNKVVRGMGFERKGLVEEPLIGYTAQYLDGIWLRAPYLHNGSVPTLRIIMSSRSG